MAGHVHADLMMQYVLDAKESDEPWLGWEFKENGSFWVQMHGHPNWYEDVEYRRKPKTISINGFDVPEPERNVLPNDKLYYFPDPRNEEMTDWYKWEGDNVDKRLLKAGMIHLTKEAAIQHAKALLSFTERKD